LLNDYITFTLKKTEVLEKKHRFFVSFGVVTENNQRLFWIRIPDRSV